MHPTYGYLRWRLNDEGKVVEDGGNIASDADLRLILSLYEAQDRWDDARYANLRRRLTNGLELVAVTNDNMLAPYGGISGETSVWMAKEVWLSYHDFAASSRLAQDSKVWGKVHESMKQSILGSQLANGLYNSQLTEQRAYGNGPDNGGYSINSLWIMVRSAQSDDPQLRASAQKALDFYKREFAERGRIVTSYSSSGEPNSSYDAPWVYALVARAAVGLDDYVFATQMLNKLREFQITDPASPHYGAIVEGQTNNRWVGQFTTQESILALQEYMVKFNSKD